MDFVSVIWSVSSVNVESSRRLSVLLLSRYDRLGASSRLRFLDFISPLAQHEIDVTAYPFVDDSYIRDLYEHRSLHFLKIARAYTRRLVLLLKAKRFDVVWIEKEALPWLPAWFETFLLRQVPYVMDLDDAWYLRYQKHPFFLLRFLLKNKFVVLAQRARSVTAGNPTLASWAKDCGAQNVVVVPTVIDLKRYPPPPESSSQIPVIGWMGSPSSARYVQMIAGALSRLRGPVRLRLVGAGSLALPENLMVDRVEWCEDTEVKDLQDFDIGIMPLEDGPWERGKCGYKLIQYMAAGRPVVASPVGINIDLIREGENGFLASSEDEWCQVLDRLSADPLLRTSLGTAGRRFVEARYTHQAVIPKLVEVLRRAAIRIP